jgi:hypothetical protein
MESRPIDHFRQEITPLPRMSPFLRSKASDGDAKVQRAERRR